MFIDMDHKYVEIYLFDSGPFRIVLFSSPYGEVPVVRFIRDIAADSTQQTAGFEPGNAGRHCDALPVSHRSSL